MTILRNVTMAKPVILRHSPIISFNPSSEREYLAKRHTAQEGSCLMGEQIYGILLNLLVTSSLFSLLRQLIILAFLGTEESLIPGNPQFPGKTKTVDHLLIEKFSPFIT